MGCLTRHTKDFIQRLKWATKIIHLIKASILQYSLDPPYSTTPRTIKYRPPCIPRWSHFLSYPYPVAYASDMVGCCVLWSIGGCLNHDKFRFILFLPLIYQWPKSFTAFPPLIVALCAISPNYSQSLWPTFGWLLCFPIQRKPSKLMAPSSLF